MHDKLLAVKAMEQMAAAITSVLTKDGHPLAVDFDRSEIVFFYFRRMIEAAGEFGASTVKAFLKEDKFTDEHIEEMRKLYNEMLAHYKKEDVILTWE